MKTKFDTSSKLLKIWKKTEKFIPYFIGFKILTFTGFITYMINRQMIYPPPQVIFGILDTIRLEKMKIVCNYFNFRINDVDSKTNLKKLF